MSSPNFERLFLQASSGYRPLTVMLELTNTCNFRCQHCYVPSYINHGLLPTPRVLEVLEELADLGTLFLGLTGGEMLLRRDWAVIAGRARALGFYTTTLTNGYLVTEAIADQIAELGLVVHISFFSTDPEVFDRVTTRPGSHARVMAAIHALHRRGVKLELKVPLMALNAEELSEIEAFAHSLGIDYSAYSRIHAKSDGNTNPLQLRLHPSQLTTFYAKPLPGRPSAETLCSAQLAEPDGSLCAAGTRMATIKADGKVVSCTIMPGEAGDLNHQSFKEIWNGSPFLTKLRDMRWTDLEGCSTCSKKAYCGRCPAQALLEDGDLYGPSHEACEHAEAIEAAARKGA